MVSTENWCHIHHFTFHSNEYVHAHSGEDETFGGFRWCNISVVEMYHYLDIILKMLWTFLVVEGYIIIWSPPNQATLSHTCQFDNRENYTCHSRLGQICAVFHPKRRIINEGVLPIHWNIHLNVMVSSLFLSSKFPNHLDLEIGNEIFRFVVDTVTLISTLHLFLCDNIKLVNCLSMCTFLSVNLAFTSWLQKQISTVTHRVTGIELLWPNFEHLTFSVHFEYNFARINEDRLGEICLNIFQEAIMLDYKVVIQFTEDS